MEWDEAQRLIDEMIERHFAIRSLLELLRPSEVEEMQAFESDFRVVGTGLRRLREKCDIAKKVITDGS